jgi:type VI secretion system Hcp family effector
MAFDAFIKFEGIAGESLDSQYKDWIEITGYSFGASQSTSITASSAGGASLGRTTVRDVIFTKLADKATAKLFEACCNGQHIQKATITVNRAGPEKLKYLEIILEEVIISDFTHQGAIDEPSEEVHLNFGRLGITYIQQKRSDGSGGGNIAGGWDRISNKTYS